MLVSHLSYNLNRKLTFSFERKKITYRMHEEIFIHKLMCLFFKIFTQRVFACLPFTWENQSVYRLGRFWQMVSKFPYWENSVRDWRLPFAEISTIHKKICTTAMANERSQNKLKL